MHAAHSYWAATFIEPRIDNWISAVRVLLVAVDQDTGKGLRQWRQVHSQGLIDPFDDLGPALNVNTSTLGVTMIKQISND
jgi:hypothetical protein